MRARSLRALSAATCGSTNCSGEGQQQRRAVPKSPSSPSTPATHGNAGSSSALRPLSAAASARSAAKRRATALAGRRPLECDARSCGAAGFLAASVDGALIAPMFPVRARSFMHGMIVDTSGDGVADSVLLDRRRRSPARSWPPAGAACRYQVERPMFAPTSEHVEDSQASPRADASPSLRGGGEASSARRLPSTTPPRNGARTRGSTR